MRASARVALPLLAAFSLVGWERAASAGPAATTGAGASVAHETKPSPVATIPVSEVRPGMEGYGLTVFAGTRPERFHVKVIGVLHNFLPKQDIILIKSDDPRLLYSGVVKGMSGSPIYLDGRLAGALAYAWSFAKDAIAGVTPIQNMEAELDRPVRGPGGTLMADAGEIDLDAFRRDPFHAAVTGRPQDAQAGGALLPELMHLLPLPQRPVVDRPGTPRLMPAAVPLMVSGMTPGGLSSLASALEPYGLEVMAGGGAGGADPTAAPGPAGFGFGDSIGVELARGDVSMTGVGTVTYVDGPHVLGFGHPMFGAGEIYLPIATANVHTVLSSLEASFKMASPIREAGTLVEDRQPCIVGDTSRAAPVVPVDVTVTGIGAAPQVFHADVARHKFLTPLIAEQVVTAALQAAVSDVTATTLRVDGTLHLRGYAPLELVDDIYSPDGVSATALAQVRAVRFLAPLLFNPFAPVDIQSIDMKLDVTFKPQVAEISSITVSDSTLPPGGRVDVYVTTHPYGGADEVVTVPLDIPAELRGQSVKIVVDDGSDARPDVAPPKSLDDLVDDLRKSYPGNSLVVSLQSADEGVTLEGQVIPDLPPSVLDSLRPAGSSDHGDTFHTSLRVVVPTSRVMEGHQEVSVKVRDDLAPR